MKKPQLKRNLVVDHLDEGFCVVTSFTPEATTWLQSNAPKYGALYEKHGSDLTMYRFYINKGFDYDVVIAYLEAMGVD